MANHDNTSFQNTSLALQKTNELLIVKPEKKFRPERDSIHDLGTGAVLYQLNFQAIWELVAL